MSIKTKLRVSAAVTIGLTLAVVITVSLQFKSVGQAERTERFAEHVIRNVSDLNSLSYAYLLLKDKRPKVQWQIKHASLGKLLSGHTVGSSEEGVLLARLRSNHEQIKRLFEAVSERDEIRPGAEKVSSAYDELNEGVAAQLMARAEMMVNDAAFLGRETQQRMDAVLQMSLIVVFCSAIILMLSAVVSASLLAKSIGGSIGALKQGTQRIASGDLGYRLGISAKDELGDLARSFDYMTERLQGATVARDLLQMEIEDRERAEEALRESERENRELLETANSIIIRWNRDGKIRFINDFGLRFFGYSKEELVGYDVMKIVPQIETGTGRDLDALVKDIVVQPERYTYVPSENIGKDGSIAYVAWTNKAIYDTGGKVREILAIGNDITELKQAEEALQHAHDSLELRVQERTVELSQAYEELRREMGERERLEEQLRQSQKMEAIGTLAGGIAHDFNNILAAILGFTEMAIDDVPDRPLVERNLKNVLSSAMRARDLVKQILAFSRKTSFERTPLPLTPLIKETVQLLRASIPTTVDIKLVISATSDTVLASPIEVQQILMNLATNASLAMQEKGGTMEIGLTDIDFAQDSPALGPDTMAGEYLQLIVKDTGTGMSPDVMKRVFEPFFTTREVGKGTGMGLAVVYGIVTDLGGTISVESEPGVGSTFRVLLPKVKAEATEDRLRAEQIPKGSEKILFVDDEEMLAEWGQSILERLGYAVTALTDPTEALKIFSYDPSRFDLVITDQAMPLLSGIQLAQELLAIRPDIPIILCTGHSETVSPETAKNAGIRQFLMKPLAKQELAESVRRALETAAEC